VSQLCYAYFRLGKSLPAFSIQDKILAGLFLSETEPNSVLAEFKPNWNEFLQAQYLEKSNTSDGGEKNARSELIVEKLKLVESTLRPEDIFPFYSSLSDDINKDEFALAFLKQPKLFLRVRPGKNSKVEKQLSENNIAFEKRGESCLALSQGVKVDELLALNREVVVQDESSQMIGQLLTNLPVKSIWKVWDACAASGGKSILAKDVLGKIELSVSDIREQMLQQLKKRLQLAEVSVFDSFPINLELGSIKNQRGVFDLIIADVPCTGSGTWSRTPEQLYYFNESLIESYSNRQYKIASNTIDSLQKGGYLLYCTCSVFKQENEAVVEKLKSNFGLIEVQAKLFSGSSRRADSLFASLLQKPL
jgi:16S rRNA (cytosine967-C5)-methyltransferase